MCGNKLLSFDLHETKSGPHGLIGGSTGSGKSELIVSMLLSLAIRYRPDYLNIILIDYKGGGIEESLSYKGKRLPHIIASINNLENDIFERLIVAIDFECKRRQRLFKELSNKALTSIMNIDDYLECDLEKYNMPKIAHLLIVVDEFAQMKKDNPEIIKELISFSRIGRSLGLHLILATQRPNGVVDEEIWSNSHFKIALKVFSEKDSNDIIKSNDAAYLTNPGEFYLGVDKSLIKATSIYSKKDFNNGDPYEISLLDNKLEVVKRKTIKNVNPITEASYAVNKILDNWKKESFSLDFSKPLEKLRNNFINSGLILGEIDDYLNAKKGELIEDIRENIFIYSTRNNEINNILNSLDRCSIVIGSRKYTNTYISDSLLYENSDDISYLFKELLNSDHDVTLIIEDLITFQSYNENLVKELYEIVRRSDIKKMNVIIISKQSLANFKLLNCFKRKYAIKIYEHQDLINIFSCRSEYKGDSYFFNGKLVSFVPIKLEELNVGICQSPPLMKYIPDDLSYLKSNNGLLIGYELINRKEIFIKEDEKILISSYDEKLIDKYKKLFINDKNVEVCLYNNKQLKSDINRIIWVGEGLYNQRLFYVDGKDELKDNEAFYYRGNKGTLIRFITNG